MTDAQCMAMEQTGSKCARVGTYTHDGRPCCHLHWMAAEARQFTWADGGVCTVRPIPVLRQIRLVVYCSKGPELDRVGERLKVDRRQVLTASGLEGDSEYRRRLLGKLDVMERAERKAMERNRLEGGERERVW